MVGFGFCGVCLGLFFVVWWVLVGGFAFCLWFGFGCLLCFVDWFVIELCVCCVCSWILGVWCLRVVFGLNLFGLVLGCWFWFKVLFCCLWFIWGGVWVWVWGGWWVFGLGLYVFVCGWVGVIFLVRFCVLFITWCLVCLLFCWCLGFAVACFDVFVVGWVWVLCLFRWLLCLVLV